MVRRFTTRPHAKGVHVNEIFNINRVCLRHQAKRKFFWVVFVVLFLFVLFFLERKAEVLSVSVHSLWVFLSFAQRGY